LNGASFSLCEMESYFEMPAKESKTKQYFRISHLLRSRTINRNSQIWFKTSDSIRESVDDSEQIHGRVIELHASVSYWLGFPFATECGCCTLMAPENLAWWSLIPFSEIFQIWLSWFKDFMVVLIFFCDQFCRSDPRSIVSDVIWSVRKHNPFGSNIMIINLLPKLDISFTNFS
jgi:hypothetical protein